MQRDVGARDQLPQAPPNGKPSFPDPCGSSSLTARARSCCPGPGSTVGNRKKPQRRHPTSTRPGQVTPATPHLLSNRLPSRCFARPDCQLLSLAVCLLTRPQISPVTRSRLNPAVSSPTSAHSPLNDSRLRLFVFPPPAGTQEHKTHGAQTAFRRKRALFPPLRQADKVAPYLAPTTAWRPPPTRRRRRTPAPESAPTYNLKPTSTVSSGLGFRSHLFLSSLSPLP